MKVYGAAGSGAELVELGIRSPGPPGRGGRRGRPTGWSPGVARRNRRFCASIDAEALSGFDLLGYTGTVRDCPATPADWRWRVDRFLKALRRRGLAHYHWVTEWQPRDKTRDPELRNRPVPHLHILLAYQGDAEAHPGTATSAWLNGNRDLGAKVSGQHSAWVRSVDGLSRYQAKHCARGGSHYQRSMEYIPEGWERVTGRVWAHSRGFPVLAPQEAMLTAEAWERLRDNAADQIESQLLARGRDRAEAMAIGERARDRYSLSLWMNGVNDSASFWDGITKGECV